MLYGKKTLVLGLLLMTGTAVSDSAVVRNVSQKHKDSDAFSKEVFVAYGVNPRHIVAIGQAVTAFRNSPEVNALSDERKQQLINEVAEYFFSGF